MFFGGQFPSESVGRRRQHHFHTHHQQQQQHTVHEEAIVLAKYRLLATLWPIATAFAIVCHSHTWSSRPIHGWRSGVFSSS